MNLGVYIHTPFCKVRCPYCDFVTTDREDLHTLHRAGYVTTLRREWALRRERHPEIAGAHLRSVFFGGGTPNLLRADEVKSLLKDIFASVESVPSDCEVTMEMNPGVTDAAALRELRAAGITRASLGVQSTHDRLLQGLGRDHSAEDARQAFRDARAAGFDNVNVDLMFAVPGQSLADWDETLAEVASWAPEHVSAYNLTAKDQTPLAAQVARGEIVLPGEAKQHAMFERAHGMLTAAGYEHVEISNYAKPGRACVHNGDVWRGEPYLGIGLGAHSCFGGERFWNTAAWDEYFKAIAAGEMPTRVDEDRDDAGKLLEDVYLGLRTREGVDFAAMKSRHGVDLLATRANAVKDLVEEGLAALENGSLRLTLKGWAVTDAVVTALV